MTHPCCNSCGRKLSKRTGNRVRCPACVKRYGKTPPKKGSRYVQHPDPTPEEIEAETKRIRVARGQPV